MVFSSTIFLFLFLPIFFFFYFFFKKRKSRNIILLLFSLLFYSYGEPIYIFLMLFSILINYYLTLIMNKKNNNKIIFILLLIFNLGLIGIFKYYNFFISSINNIFSLNIHYLKLSLPIGISFYTFQILTYVIDVYKGKVKVQESILNLGCYIASFPQLIAGPIVRYEEINKEIENRKENTELFTSGLKRFIVGLAKKVLLANELAYIADSIFGSNLKLIGFLGSFIALICYTLQIYYDFSGYSDMAIGLGQMLGFHYSENFNFPYIAQSITEFWRRWHISLSTFFRDYVYIPLGGNRVSIPRHILNILIVWFLTGLWHGASFNFILWGLYYALLLLIEKYLLKNILPKLPHFLKHLYTIFLIMLGWLIFYFTDLNNLYLAFKSLIGIYGLGSITLLKHLQIFKIRSIIIFIISIIFIYPFHLLTKNTYLNNILYLILFIISIIFILGSNYNPFIYFRF